MFQFPGFIPQLHHPGSPQGISVGSYPSSTGWSHAHHEDREALSTNQILPGHLHAQHRQVTVMRTVTDTLYNSKFSLKKPRCCLFVKKKSQTIDNYFVLPLRLKLPLPYLQHSKTPASDFFATANHGISIYKGRKSVIWSKKGGIPHVFQWPEKLEASHCYRKLFIAYSPK